MTTAPRHLSTAPADSGASARISLMAAAHRRLDRRDAWAGHPDTDKHWSNDR